MDKLLPQTLSDGSSSEVRETFERWHADHRKVRSIILAFMSNDVQKQYDRLDNVASILQRMKEVYAIPDRHTRYVPTKEFFRAKMTEGSSVQEHGVKMLSLVELGLIMTCNAIKKSAPSVLIEEASTSKAKGKRTGCWKRKNGKAKAKTVVIAKDAKSAPIALVGMGKGKRRMGTQQQSRANDICAHCCEKGHWKRDCPNLSCNQGMLVVEVLQRSRKLSKDEVVLRPGDGYAVVAEAPTEYSGQRGFSYFITFTDYHSRYNYVYLMRYKSEAVLRFKEFRLEVENQTVSQWTPPGTPQLNCVAKRRNRTLLDMIRSMMSFTELSLSFWGYVLETVARFIGYLKETAGYYFYDLSKQKVFVSRNVVFLERGFPMDTRRDELLLEESSEAPQSNAGTSSAPTVSIGNVSILRRSARVPQAPERYGFLVVTSQLDNDPKTYGEARSDIDSGKWLEAMKY
ncbi:UNVERIFIED_CONTAM: hypothetical protein Sradi_5098800 [Sesamum radiatum]|uniref:CCHC-type domain-containing protein n=1 Tax=Sesamum radiatum TaxID=300843 RepID=A0AAW2M1H6_SESRA